MALWGALVKPSSKDTSCKFILNQLASNLLTATGNLTSSIGSTFGSNLNLPQNGGVQPNQIGGSTNKLSDKKSSATSHKQSGGLLGGGLL